MDIKDLENYERIKKGLIFVGHNLEPYTRNGMKLLHQKIQTCLPDNKPCQLKCSVTFGNDVRRWCKTCDNWRQKLLSFCSVPASMSWKRMESWKWPFEYTTISLVYLPGSWKNHVVDFNDFSTACYLWQRCKIYHIPTQIIKSLQIYSDKYMSIHGRRMATDEEKQHVFYALEELFCQRDVESSLESHHEYYTNELYRISWERKYQSGEIKQDMKKVTYLKTRKQLDNASLHLVSRIQYVSRILILFLGTFICIKYGFMLSVVLLSYYKLDMLVLHVDFMFLFVITLVALVAFIGYFLVNLQWKNAYVTDQAEKLLSYYERNGICKPWKPKRTLTEMFDFTLQHSFQSESKDMFKSALTIVSGTTMRESSLCIKDVLDIWGDTIRYRNNIFSTNTKLASGLAKFRLTFHIRVRKNEVIHNLHEFISKKIADVVERLSVPALPRCEYLVILDLNTGKIRASQKLHLQKIGAYKVVIFVHDSHVVAKRACGVDRLSCSELLAQCGKLTTLNISRRKRIMPNYMHSVSNDCVMKHLGEEINSVVCLKSFQCESATKIFDIIFTDIRSPDSFITAELHLRNDYENRQSYIRKIELVNCDSSILLIHPAEEVLFKEGYHLDDLLVSNCMLCVPSCVNLKTVVFSNLIIGRKTISITLSQKEIKKFKFCTRLHDTISEIFMPYFENATSFDKEDFVLEDQLCNSIGKEIILHQVCHRLVDSDSCIVEAYAAMSKDDSVFIVGLTRDLPSTCQSLSHKVFRDFAVEFRPYYPSSNKSLRAENSFENSDEVLDENFTKQLFAINETVSFHAEKLMEQHSNLEAVKVSSVRITGENCVNACPCVVLYCRCKSFIPYGESPFPSSLKHPSEDITFPTNIREGYFISCTNGNVMTGFAKLWNKELAMGCSIGPENESFSATCGPFVDVKETGESCFLTVRHLFQPLSKPDLQVKGTKLVQPADGDIIPSQAFVNPNPVAGGGTGQQGSNIVRRCGEVIASALNKTVDAALVKIDDERAPTRGNYVSVTRDDLHFAGFSNDSFPTYDDGSTLDARILTVQTLATDRVIKFGKETGLRKGTLRLSSMAVKEVICTGSVQLNGRPYTHNLKNQLQIDSYAVSAFFQRGDSGSAVFLVDKDNKLHCIGMAIGVMSDLTAVVTPIQNILHELGRRLGKTLEMKKFELEKMDES